MKRNHIIISILLAIAACGALSFAAWMVMDTSAMMAGTNPSAATQPMRGQPFARVNIPKPSNFDLMEIPAPLPTVEILPATPNISAEPQISPTQVESPIQATPTIQDLALQTPTAPPDDSSSGLVSAAIVPDTPTPEYAAPSASYSAGGGERWIDVNLSQQRVYAYEGDTVVNSFIVSTGTWQTPTVTGKFNIWVKLRSATMSGPGYYLKNVPYVMYFHGSYGLHGTYWHTNFGTPMSHGCVNLSIPDAEWLYNFSSVGTVVNVHY